MSRFVQKQVLRQCIALNSSSQRTCLSAYRRISTPSLALSLSTVRTQPFHSTRLFSTTTATTTAATKPTIHSTHTTNHSSTSHHSTTTREVKVVSYYLSPLDLVDLSYPSNTLKFTRPACTLVPFTPPTATTATTTAAAPVLAADFDVYSSYAIVFDYGAIVFFNTTDAQQQSFLPTNTTTTVTTITPSTSLRLRDDYTVTVDPLLTATTSTQSTASSRAASAALACAFHTDSVHVSALDIYSVRVIAQILAQTISMEYYEDKTSSMLSEFHSLSLHMSNSGTLPPTLTASSSSNLIKLLAQNNTILTSLLTHVRLLDRSEISWRYGQYDQLWEGMRSEFSITERYETLETKLRLLHENHPLFLEVLHHKQGHRMELIIIYLIAIEVLLAVVFHSPIVGWIMEELGLAEKGKIRTYD